MPRRLENHQWMAVTKTTSRNGCWRRNGSSWAIPRIVSWWQPRKVHEFTLVTADEYLLNVPGLSVLHNRC